MERQIATTREQSDRLLQCGVPAESADMSWFRTWGNVGDFNLNVKPYSMMVRINEESCRGRNEITPAFSLSALLSLLPKEIEIDGYPYRISIYFENPDEPVIGNQWCLYYKPKKHNEKSRIDDVTMYAPDLIECAVLMIIWLTKRGYNLNRTEKGGSEHGED